LAPERNKELITVSEVKLAAHTLYPYRLKHRDPAELATVELVNATTKTVEINIQCSGHNLPKLSRGLALTESERTAIAIPVPHVLQDLPAGAYEYEVRIVAFQRGRQEIKRQLIFEMKDTHDWSGDSRDLNYFIQPEDDEIMKTARLLLARSRVNSRPEAVAECFYNFFRDSLRYVPDPRPLRQRQDRVQYAAETLKFKSGDCEDFTILMVSLLEGVGVQAAFVEAMPPRSKEGHVFLLFDSQQRTAEVIDRDNLQRYIVRQNDDGSARLFIPLELTRLEQSFENAWHDALALYQKLALDEHGLAEGWVKIIDTPAALTP
jgi:transglutaminase-like putative cysteine protease